MSSKLIKRGPVPELVLEDPTGEPSWPLILLSGVEGSGKSFLSAAASASELIGRTFYLPIGETGIDEYGAIPGARFKKLKHDGTFMSIARQAWAAVEQPRTDGKANLIVVDSATELWDLVSAEQQEIVNDKAVQRGRGRPGEDAEMGFDSWNAAKKRWRAFIDLMREHDGPVVFTARLEEVADAKAILAGNKNAPMIWKPRVEKNLPYDVDAVFQARQPRVWLCTKVRSLELTVEPDEELRMPDREFGMDWFWKKLGLTPESAGTRPYVAPDAEAYKAEHAADVAEQYAAAQGQQQRERQPGQRAGQRPVAEWLRRIEALTGEEQGRALWREMRAAGQDDVDHQGVSLGDRVIGKVEKLKVDAKKAPAGSAAEAATEEPKGEPTADVAGNAPAADTAAPAAAERPKLTEPDDGELRRNTAQRRGVIGGIVHEFGDSQEAADAAAEQEFGLPMEQLGTKRLRDWLTNDLMRGAR